MKLPSPVGFETFEAVAAWARRLIQTINAQWATEHDDSGAHVFASEPVPFDATNFLASGSMTFTVAAGEVITHRYSRIGRQLRLTFEISSATVGGTASSNLRIRLPNNLRARGRHAGTFAYVDNGTAGTGVWIIVDGGNELQLFKDYSLTTWNVAGTNTSVVGSADFEVQ